MDEPEPTVELTVPIALVNAIGQLAIHCPLVSHADAWRVLTAELSKRELGVPAKPIVLAQRHYDALPSSVPAALQERGEPLAGGGGP